MDSLFGDASTAAGTPQMRAETGSLRGGSPAPSDPLRGRQIDNNIPPLDIGSVEPPYVPIVDGKPQYRSQSRGGSRARVGEWLNRVTGPRGTSGSPAARGRYRSVDQRPDNE